MRFTNHIATIVIVGFLSACSSSPAKKSDAQSDKENTPALSESVEAGASILPAGPVTPNPYLQNRPSVSRAAQQSFADATRAMRNKQWALAQSHLEKVIAENNKLSGAHLNLGLVYRAQQENKRAEQAFNDAIMANHTNLDAYNQLAILQREAGKFSEAESNYKKALSIWPFHAESHKNIAILYDLYMGKSAEALPHYEAYLQLRGGDDKQVVSWIADLQRRLGIAPKPKKAAVSEPVQAPLTNDVGEFGINQADDKDRIDDKDQTGEKEQAGEKEEASDE
ncbi:tetratricopeptide repeat protein [Cellvibrio sp. pealriver]|uniref:tetratricopeptide repeat protein n=1 Tax=Cellvibrio sp. pealriver TaxID=1622269 RepID=UPI0009E26610|nr:tetratricopeptide repeat protein [Cellvibrio sp. pealriver]